jgi:hypothetical protein
MLSWLSMIFLGFLVLVFLAAGLSLVVQSMPAGPDRVTFTAGSAGYGGAGRSRTTDMEGTFTVTKVAQGVRVGGRMA